jgi:tetratricopeptide (TPR) repeat protein
MALPIEVGSPPRLYAQLLGAALHKTANHSQAIQDLAWRLIRVAEIACGARDRATLKEVAELLTGLPLQAARDAGLYYLAIIAWRQGDLEQSRQLLDPLTESISPIIQARAVQTLGTVYEAQGDTGDAVRLYTETLRAARHSDSLALSCAMFQLSSIKSAEGDHSAALADLQNALPVARLAARQHPHLWPLYHNELACELRELGRINEARAHSRVACNSQIAAKYDEWQETAEDLREPERVLVVVPEVKAEPKAERQVKSFNRLEFLIDFDFLNVRKVQPASNSLRSQTIQPAIIAQVKTRAPDRAPPASM